MGNIYTGGEYLEATQTWHAEDSPWKARQIKRIIDNNGISLKKVAEIGCGSGVILDELSKLQGFESAQFKGYDISPQAIELTANIYNERISFFQEDLLAENDKNSFDLLLVIDVFEHVPDYMRFVEKCRSKAKYKIYHIPLDIHVSSVMRNAFIRNRYTIGHIHYFTADSALATLRDTGHEIVDTFYTNAAFGLFKEHPTFKKAFANIPRWLISKFSVALSARLFGGYSLMVLAK